MSSSKSCSFSSSMPSSSSSASLPPFEKDEVLPHRFFDVDCADLDNFCPLRHTSHTPTTSLNDAVLSAQPNFPQIYLRAAAMFAKSMSDETRKNLTLDEAASIHLYTLEDEEQKESLAFILNEMLRQRKCNQHRLKNFIPYLRIFLSAIEKLPQYSGIVYRGILCDVSEVYAAKKGRPICWWSIASCSTKEHILKQFESSGSTSTRPKTLFAINTRFARNIHSFSSFRTGFDAEWILAPGCQLMVTSVSHLQSGMKVIELRETEQPWLFEILSSAGLPSMPSTSLCTSLSQSQIHPPTYEEALEARHQNLSSSSSLSSASSGSTSAASKTVTFPFTIQAQTLFQLDGTAAELLWPLQVCVAEEKVWLVDQGHHCVKVFDIHGNFLQYLGEPGDADGQLQSPTGVAVYGKEVFVADASHWCIKVFTLSGEFKRKWGKRGSDRSVGEFGRMWHITVDDERLYVVDQKNDGIHVFELSGRFLQFISTATGSEEVGGNSKAESPSEPYGLCVVDQRVYVTDSASDGCIKVFSAKNGQFLGCWKSTRGSGGLAAAHNLVWACDFFSQSINVLTLDGTLLTSAKCFTEYFPVSVSVRDSKVAVCVATPDGHKESVEIFSLE